MSIDGIVVRASDHPHVSYDSMITELRYIVSLIREWTEAAEKTKAADHWQTVDLDALATP